MGFEVFKKLKFLEQEKFYVWMTALFLFVQGVIIAITTVNVPAGDEWDSLLPNALPAGFTWQYIFSFLNEHRGVFTRLQNYFFFRFTDWNMAYQIYFNYLVFCFMVGFLFYVEKKHVAKASKGVWVLLFFLASPLLVDNHNWAIQSFFHYCELFGLLAMYFATAEKLRLREYLLAAVFAVFSTYAFAAGMFFAFTVVVVLGYRLCQGFRTSSEGVASRESTVTTIAKALTIVAMVLAMGAWFVGFHKNPAHPALVWPHQWEFWYFFANLISLGFGFKTSSAIIALIAMGIVFVVLWSSLKKAFTFEKQYVSFAFFTSVAVVGALASIALSRTGFGIGQAKTSRYAELGILFVPFIGWLWWTLAQGSARYQKSFKYFIWFVCLGFIGDYSYGTYFRVASERKESLECIRKYYHGQNPTALCPILYPGSIAGRLDTAKQLKLSWVPQDL
jgi:hypothetical protein